MTGGETPDNPEARAAEAAELASQQADPERLMDGEDPETEELEDAEHWLNVYRELHAFKEDAQDEAQADERLLELELARFENREQFWRARIADLEGR
jgi:hypothetical protein